MFSIQWALTEICWIEVKEWGAFCKLQRLQEPGYSSPAEERNLLVFYAHHSPGLEISLHLLSAAPPPSHPHQPGLAFTYPPPPASPLAFPSPETPKIQSNWLDFPQFKRSLIFFYLSHYCLYFVYIFIILMYYPWALLPYPQSQPNSAFVTSSTEGWQ